MVIESNQLDIKHNKKRIKSLLTTIVCVPEGDNKLSKKIKAYQSLTQWYVCERKKARNNNECQ